MASRKRAASTAAKKPNAATLNNASETSAASALPSDRPLLCGVVMPISELDGCVAEHWLEVKSIITEAIESIGEFRFTAKLVSDADEIGVIQKRIVQTIYSADMIVCDVSGKNPNVMFELGMRLAFDKAAVIIKDDKTAYSFDTGVIEHIGYPRDLRFAKIVDFKKSLADKVAATYRASIAGADHSVFLKNFGQFQVASLSETEVPASALLLETLQDIQRDIGLLQRRGDIGSPRSISLESGTDLSMGVARMVESIKKYRLQRGISDNAKLTPNEKLYSFVERDASAPAFFDSPQQFRATVDAFLRATARDKK
jgi:hypothetical protein